MPLQKLELGSLWVLWAVFLIVLQAWGEHLGCAGASGLRGWGVHNSACRQLSGCALRLVQRAALTPQLHVEPPFQMCSTVALSRLMHVSASDPAEPSHKEPSAYCGDACTYSSCGRVTAAAKLCRGASAGHTGAAALPAALWLLGTCWPTNAQNSTPLASPDQTAGALCGCHELVTLEPTQGTHRTCLAH